MDSTKNILSVDIGGTKIAAAIADGSGQTIAQKRFPTPQDGDASNWVKEVGAQLKLFIAEAEDPVDVAGFFLSTVGPIRSVNGRLLINPPNIKPLQNLVGGTPYAEQLAQFLQLPYNFDNDGNTATAAEILDPAGAAFGRSNLAVLVWSSGVGCGFYADGKLLHFSPRDPASWANPELSLIEKNSFEIGHVIVESDTKKSLQCGDGAWGHLEAHLGGAAAIGRNENPAESHQRLMDDGLRYLPGALAPVLAGYGIDQVVITGTTGKALFRDHPQFPGQLSDAFAKVAGGADVSFVASTIENASLRGAQLLGIQAFDQGLLQLPGGQGKDSLA